VWKAIEQGSGFVFSELGVQTILGPLWLLID
jgi:hypothetical protein